MAPALSRFTQCSAVTCSHPRGGGSCRRGQALGGPRSVPACSLSHDPGASGAGWGGGEADVATPGTTGSPTLSPQGDHACPRVDLHGCQVALVGVSPGCHQCVPEVQGLASPVVSVLRCPLALCRGRHRSLPWDTAPRAGVDGDFGAFEGLRQLVMMVLGTGRGWDGQEQPVSPVPAPSALAGCWGHLCALSCACSQCWGEDSGRCHRKGH